LQVAPAVAAGNTFIFKSSEKSPLAVLYLGELFRQAGFPPGVVNLISGGGKVGSLLASHMDIAKISFTGSGASGRLVQIAAAESNLKHVSLELGGKSPAIIFDDANIENAVVHNSHGFLLNSGQVCFAGSRILVQRSIAPRFIEALKDAFISSSKKMDDPASEATVFGPLADKAQYDRVMGFLEGAKQDGIEVLTGGVRKGERGQFVEPTILMNPDTNNRVYTDEIFGPVVTVKTFETEEEAVEMANSTTYGLGGK
jgi:aldehyde dehydrogenase (NAD+)